MVVSFVCYLSLLRNVRRSDVDIISRGSTFVTHFFTLIYVQVPFPFTVSVVYFPSVSMV